MRALFLTGLVLSIIAYNAVAEETKPVNGFTLLNKPQAAPTPVDYGAGVPVTEAQKQQDEAACRVRKTVEAGVSMGGVSGKYAGARMDYGKDDRALDRGYAPNPCPKTGFAMSLAVSASDMEVKRRDNGRTSNRSPFSVENEDQGMPGPRFTAD